MNPVDDLMTIGALASRCGLTVTALRFYDREGVLVPAFVDAATGYRRYATDQVEDALLLASLRRIGVPVSELRDAVELRRDHEELDALLDAHLDRLARGLDGARAEVAAVRSRRTRVSFTVATTAEQLRHALGCVRFAAGTDPEVPVLQGVRLRLQASRVDLVATDRYRLARQELPLRACSGAGATVLPPSLVDDLLEERTCGPASLTVDGDRIRVVTGREHLAQAVPGEYPNIDLILPSGSGGRRLSDDWLDSLPGGHEEGTRDLDGVAVREEFLLEALAAAGSDPTLRLDGPLSPVVLRGEGHLSLIMPVRPEQD